MPCGEHVNPVIKFTTPFGLLAVELALEPTGNIPHILAAVFFAISASLVYRSFDGMRIQLGRA
jgi:K(+)-stimulated pyrophosphate-energized sodium pump